ncbi:hypothetical protein QN277_005761 [Acacia crassicarpa]|uniref:Uncharacterized protein n=1 Tax=Acacia crassicarpa TaxID=499986 RepID=A0AAE1JU73_9FABA|nr:hypothetical protein QN277_005761 [Acacia crassicarpa]
MADPIFKSLVAFALFASLLLCSSLADASSDVPFILAHKKATLNRLKPGAERVSVTIDIHNQGTSFVPLLNLFLIRSVSLQILMDVNLLNSEP